MSSKKYIPPYKVGEEAVNLIAEISAAVERFDIEISGVKGVRLRKTNRSHRKHRLGEPEWLLPRHTAFNASGQFGTVHRLHA